MSELSLSNLSAGGGREALGGDDGRDEYVRQQKRVREIRETFEGGAGKKWGWETSTTRCTME